MHLSKSNNLKPSLVKMYQGKLLLGIRWVTLLNVSILRNTYYFMEKGPKAKFLLKIVNNRNTFEIVSTPGLLKDIAPT